MILRLKTSLDVETKLNELQSFLQVSSRAAVMRLAIGYSLRIKEPVDNSYNVKNQRGTDYNRFTIFGDDELVYKVLMEEHIRAHIEEDDFFPGYTNAHIERGIKELYADYKLYNNREKLLKKILA